MPRIIVLLVSLVFSISYVFAAPVNFGINVMGIAHRLAAENAAKVVNEYFAAIHKLLQNLNTGDNALKLETAFGKNCRDKNYLDQIKDTVDKLANSPTLLWLYEAQRSVKPPPKSSSQIRWGYFDKTWKLMVFEHFFDQAESRGQLELLAAVSQGVAGTVNFFTHEFKPIDKKKKGGYGGKLGEKFVQVRDEGGTAACVHNAASFMLLGHLARNGFVDLPSDMPGHEKEHWMLHPSSTPHTTHAESSTTGSQQASHGTARPPSPAPPHSGTRGFPQWMLNPKP